MVGEERVNDEQFIEAVMEKVEKFYFEDGEEYGEVTFNNFAEKQVLTFEDECDAEEPENKLE